MKLLEILTALRTERKDIDEAIRNLTKLQQERNDTPAGLPGTKKRGRPLGSKNARHVIPIPVGDGAVH